MRRVKLESVPSLWWRFFLLWAFFFFFSPLLSGLLFASLVIMVNIYAPNFDDYNIFHKLFSMTPSNNNYNLIIGGDFNCVLNTSLDRSSSNTQSLTKSAELIKDFMIKNGVSDIWIFIYDSKYTCIDYFLLDNRLLGNISSCSYHSITVSDHGAVSFHIALPKCFRPSCYWRLNPLLLADEKFLNHISTQIDFIF